ncbi:hypothetical protein OG342_07045 [Streptomyces bobili]|uniref:hypothetical protein n=1 Tax=Streptomyces bobili TaxID=67280 RepID=UPI00225052F7|nr:hypothetical protein [Streptomyces bobili]MCX5522620.1 hypothetical protein [Streptomyces bobili]
MDLYFVRTDPVQQIAAEPATLDLLLDILRPKAVEQRAAPELLAAVRACDWPLVYDETLRPGIVHCRPMPGAGPPPTGQELAEWMRALAPSSQRELGDGPSVAECAANDRRWPLEKAGE